MMQAPHATPTTTPLEGRRVFAPGTIVTSTWSWRDKIKREWNYLRDRRVLLMLMLSTLILYCNNVMRNIVYLLHPADLMPLPDAGFKLLPDLSASGWLSEAVFGTLFWTSYILLVLHPLFVMHKPAVTSSYIFIDCLTFFVMMFTLRVICFLSTWLPGPSEHCRNTSPNFHPPENVLDLLFKFEAYKGCGDLIFSGHCTLMCISALAWTKYTSWYFPPNFYCKFMRTVVWLALFTLSVLVVATRKHYTVDVVIVYMVLIPWWHVYNHHVVPNFIPFPIDAVGDGDGVVL